MATNLKLPDNLFSKIQKTEDKIDQQEGDILREDERKERLRSLQLKNFRQ